MRLERLRLGYECWWPDRAVKARVRGLLELRGGLSAELEVVSEREEGEGHLLFTRVDLLSLRDRQLVSRHLAEIARMEPGAEGPLNPWVGMIEEACYRVALEHRGSGSALPLGEFSPMDDGRFLLWPYLEPQVPTVLYGTGGAMKSYLALAMALSVATGEGVVGPAPSRQGQVLILDFEHSGGAWRARRDLLLAGLPLVQDRWREVLRASGEPIRYRRMAGSLASSLEAVLGDLQEWPVDLVIVDAIGGARGGDANSNELTNLVFDAMRELGTTVLALDHLAKGEKVDKTKPFGSAYTDFRARATWLVERIGLRDPQKPTLVSLTNSKRNGEPLPKQLVEFTWMRDDQGRMRSVVPAVRVPGIEEPGGRVSQGDRVMETLRGYEGGSATTKDLAMACGLAENSMRSVLFRLKEKGAVQQLAQGRWKVVEEEE